MKDFIIATALLVMFILNVSMYVWVRSLSNTQDAMIDYLIEQNEINTGMINHLNTIIDMIEPVKGGKR